MPEVNTNLRQAMKHRRFRLWVSLVLIMLLAIYIGSYVVLSSNGCYEPGAIGLAGVKAYRWAPRGFVVGYNWQRYPMMVYAPLLFLDERLWHTEKKMWSGQYPVDEVEPKDIWKVYQAYGCFDQEEPSEAETEKTKK